MMSMSLIFMLIISVTLMIYSNNPMKASFSILIISSLMFLMIKMKTGLTWMPLIFFILFTGGILMVFMILASILPNEKVKKIKISKMIFIFMILVCLVPQTKNMETLSVSSHMKAFITSSLTLTFMISLILIYFFCVMNMNTTSETSMRSLMC